MAIKPLRLKKISRKFAPKAFLAPLHYGAFISTKMGTWGPRGHSWTRASWSLTLRALRSGAEWQIFYFGSTPIFC